MPVLYWRRHASNQFPDLRYELASADYSSYLLFMELRTKLRAACESGDEGHFDRIMNFAAWCLEQDNEDLENAAVVAFYEHVFEDCARWRRILERLKPEQISDWWGLWDHISAVALREIYKLAIEVHNPRDLKIGERWYLDDLMDDSFDIAARAAERRTYLRRLLETTFRDYSDGRLPLSQLTEDVVVCIWEFSTLVEPGWVSDAHNLWTELEEINAWALDAGLHARHELSDVTNAEISKIIDELRRLLDDGRASQR